MDHEAGDEGCELLYQIICLQNTPPMTSDEQALCMKARSSCWRLRDPVASGGRARRATESADET